MRVRKENKIIRKENNGSVKSIVCSMAESLPDDCTVTVKFDSEDHFKYILDCNDRELEVDISKSGLSGRAIEVWDIDVYENFDDGDYEELGHAESKIVLTGDYKEDISQVCSDAISLVMGLL